MQGEGEWSGRGILEGPKEASGAEVGRGERGNIGTGVIIFHKRHSPQGPRSSFDTPAPPPPHTPFPHVMGQVGYESFRLVGHRSATPALASG
jgi:hypothetical protein